MITVTRSSSPASISTDSLQEIYLAFIDDLECRLYLPCFLSARMQATSRIYSRYLSRERIKNETPSGLSGWRDDTACSLSFSPSYIQGAKSGTDQRSLILSPMKR
jgi:hypothetical protein